MLKMRTGNIKYQSKSHKIYRKTAIGMGGVGPRRFFNKE